MSPGMVNRQHCILLVMADESGYGINSDDKHESYLLPSVLNTVTV